MPLPPMNSERGPGVASFPQTGQVGMIEQRTMVSPVGTLDESRAESPGGRSAPGPWFMGRFQIVSEETLLDQGIDMKIEDNRREVQIKGFPGEFETMGGRSGLKTFEFHFGLVQSKRSNILPDWPVPARRRASPKSVTGTEAATG